jgi:hypothetical protein
MQVPIPGEFDSEFGNFVGELPTAGPTLFGSLLVRPRGGLGFKKLSQGFPALADSNPASKVILWEQKVPAFSFGASKEDQAGARLRPELGSGISPSRKMICWTMSRLTGV